MRLKRKKMLEQDAAKCAKLTDLFRGKRSVRREQDTAA